MNKKVYHLVICAICISSFFLGVKTAEAYVSKTVSGCYRTDFTSGIAVSGTEQIANAGIGYTNTGYYTDVLNETFRKILRAKEVVLVHVHGAVGYIALTSSTKLSGTTTASWEANLSTKLLYLSACKAGTASSSYGDLPYNLVKKGVGTVVSFKENVSASTESNGIHQFNLLAITNMTNGYSVSQAMAMAYTTFRGLCTEGNYYGADSYRITGNGDYMLRHT